MNSNDRTTFKLGYVVIIVVVIAWVQSCVADARRDRYRACMNEKRDHYICETYSWANGRRP